MNSLDRTRKKPGREDNKPNKTIQKPSNRNEIKQTKKSIGLLIKKKLDVVICYHNYYYFFLFPPLLLLLTTPHPTRTFKHQFCHLLQLNKVFRIPVKYFVSQFDWQKSNPRNNAQLEKKTDSRLLRIKYTYCLWIVRMSKEREGELDCNKFKYKFWILT